MIAKGGLIRPCKMSQKALISLHLALFLVPVRGQRSPTEIRRPAENPHARALSAV